RERERERERRGEQASLKSLGPCFLDIPTSRPGGRSRTFLPSALRQLLTTIILKKAFLLLGSFSCVLHERPPHFQHSLYLTTTTQRPSPGRALGERILPLHGTNEWADGPVSGGFLNITALPVFRDPKKEWNAAERSQRCMSSFTVHIYILIYGGDPDRGRLSNIAFVDCTRLGLSQVNLMERIPVVCYTTPVCDPTNSS
ncbi:hypothetical protein F4778DRAFT_728389, partial [Xylariomycetidae sp. FL2044]